MIVLKWNQLTADQKKTMEAKWQMGRGGYIYLMKPLNKVAKLFRARSGTVPKTVATVSNLVRALEQPALCGVFIRMNPVTDEIEIAAGDVEDVQPTSGHLG